MRKTVLTIVLCLGFMVSAGAGELQFYFESSEAYPGMPVQLVLHAVDSRAVDRPALPEVRGLSLIEAGQSRYEQRTLGGGGSSRQVTTEYRWLVTPQTSGRFTIPSITVEMKDGDRRTESLYLDVKEPGPIEGYHLFLDSDGATVFPGMPVRVTLKWLFSSEVSRPDFTLPFLSREDLSVEDLGAPSSSTSDIYQFEAEGHTLYALQSAEIYEGKQYASLSISWDIYPDKPGSLELEPVYLAFQRVVKDSYGRKSYAPAVIPSNSLIMKVKPLPDELSSFPAGVLIARDSLEIEASLDQKKVYPGDPIELTLRIKGLVNPGLTRFKGVDALGEETFRTEPGSLHVSLEGKDKVVRQTIRMLKSGSTVFPELEFPYYNMSEDKVDTFRTAPLDLEVLVLEKSDLNTRKDQSFFQEEELTDDGALTLKANHRVFASIIPETLYRMRWIILTAAILLLLLSQFFRFSGTAPALRKNIKNMEYHEFKEAVREFHKGSGNDHAALVMVHNCGSKWLRNSLNNRTEKEGSSHYGMDFIDAFQNDLNELDSALWIADSEIDSGLKERFLKWPGKIKSAMRRRRS